MTEVPYYQVRLLYLCMLGCVKEAIKESASITYWPQFCEFVVSSCRNWLYWIQITWNTNSSFRHLLMYMQPSFDIPTLTLSNVPYRYLWSIINVFPFLCLMVKSMLKLGKKSVKNLVDFLGDLKTPKFHSEINWPLSVSQSMNLTRSHGDFYFLHTYLYNNSKVTLYRILKKEW